MKQLTSLKAVSENPFYKMTSSLRLLQELPKADDDNVTRSVVQGFLTSAWAECKDSKEKRQLFNTILFSLGDISNRSHNIYQKSGIKDIENGGSSKRRTFALCLEWLVNTNPEQFYAFLPIIGEYYNLDGTMLYELRTDRFKGSLKEILHIPVDIDRITRFIAHTLKDSRTTENDKFLWAKWLPHVPTGDRTRKYIMTDKNIKAFQKGNADLKIGDTVVARKGKKQHTLDKDQWIKNFIYALSKYLDWEVIKHKNNTEYKGYADFKKAYLGLTEAHLFSSKKICEFDKIQFFEWIDKQPSGARFAVQRRIVEKDKVGKLSARNKWLTNKGDDLGMWYLEWTKSKERAQEVMRNLTPEAKKELAPKELKALEKEAKVNTGAETILDIIAKLLGNKSDMANVDLMAHSLLEKVKMEVPALVIGDVSGSMSSVSVTHKGIRFTAQHICQLIVTIFLLKNPDEELADMFIRFDDHAEVICTGQKAIAAGQNRFMGTSSKVVEVLVDKTKKFSENLNNVSQYIISRGSTNFSSVSTALKAWVDIEPSLSSQRKEQINKYPVIVCVGDGCFNSSETPAASLLDFKRNMLQWFGWDGVVVIWDVHQQDLQTNKFENVDNVIYYGGCNIGILTSLFTKLSDIEPIDVYTVLNSFSKMNRYLPVRDLTI